MNLFDVQREPPRISVDFRTNDIPLDWSVSSRMYVVPMLNASAADLRAIQVFKPDPASRFGPEEALLAFFHERKLRGTAIAAMRPLTDAAATPVSANESMLAELYSNAQNSPRIGPYAQPHTVFLIRDHLGNWFGPLMVGEVGALTKYNSGVGPTQIGKIRFPYHARSAVQACCRLLRQRAMSQAPEPHLPNAAFGTIGHENLCLMHRPQGFNIVAYIDQLATN